MPPNEKEAAPVSVIPANSTSAVSRIAAEVEFAGITETGAASFSFGGTKRELGENYGMMPSGTWYTQADAYAVAAIGKTADDIATLASEGVAGCTIYAGEYKQGIEAAVKAAR